MTPDNETKPFDHPLPGSGGSWINEGGVLKPAPETQAEDPAPPTQPKGKAKAKEA